MDGARSPRARFPNANPEIDIWPTGWVPDAQKWLPAKPPSTQPVYVTSYRRNIVTCHGEPQRLVVVGNRPGLCSFVSLGGVLGFPRFIASTPHAPRPTPPRDHASRPTPHDTGHGRVDVDVDADRSTPLKCRRLVDCPSDHGLNALHTGVGVLTWC